MRPVANIIIYHFIHYGSLNFAAILMTHERDRERYSENGRRRRPTQIYIFILYIYYLKCCDNDVNLAEYQW